MRPDEYAVIGGTSVGAAYNPPPSKPAITATRLKGDPIMETRQVQVGTTSGKVLLELTPYAAEVLRGLVGKVCGPDDGPRGQINQIYNALNAARVVPFELLGEDKWILKNIWIQ